MLHQYFRSTIGDEGKEELDRLRTNNENEFSTRRKEIQRQEKRIQQKEGCY